MTTDLLAEIRERARRMIADKVTYAPVQYAEDYGVLLAELDRLRAACCSAAVLLRATADQPHPNSDALRAAARELDTIAQEAPRA